uniref:Uncharacterized protein n=1 Tax=Glossina palpalis gambiensis TaxID=67801 RepID=A0A1B0ASG0_9MUSC
MATNYATRSKMRSSKLSYENHTNSEIIKVHGLGRIARIVGKLYDNSSLTNRKRRTTPNSRILTLHCGAILNHNLLFTTFLRENQLIDYFDVYYTRIYMANKVNLKL